MKNPGAWIAVKKNRIKHHGTAITNTNRVYLTDKTNFQIEVFNPLSEVLLARIFVNGDEIGKSGLVLRPGERVFLDRFLSKSKKFKFRTYDVEDSKEARKAIEKNGRVSVRFFKRKNYTEYSTTYDPDWYSITWGSSSGCGCGGNCGCGSNVNTAHTVLDVNPNWSSATSDMSNFTYTSGTTAAVNTFAGGNIRTADIKTGRVEEGGKSKQKFTEVNYDFVEYSFWSEDIHILPIENQPVEAVNIRDYCTECGRRLKKGWNFCAGCGCEC